MPVRTLLTRVVPEEAGVVAEVLPGQGGVVLVVLLEDLVQAVRLIDAVQNVGSCGQRTICSRARVSRTFCSAQQLDLGLGLRHSPKSTDFTTSRA